MRCHNCGSDKTESDSASGTSYCIDCGTVLEENTIVAEVTFGETAGGKAVLQGSYAGESGRISGGGLFGRNRGREGQEQAIENGRVKIASLAHAVRLPERYRDAAQRYYNLAVVNRFTRGRRSDHVAAVCLYAVCRAEKSSHMLIDFSDILQVNVFTIGATFLKLCRVLNLNLPHVDPSLYISRFAAALDFGDYTQRVAQDAVRIAQRMDRDWITSGRRPAGICGACLLIAARMNGFRRTTREMIYIVKVADVTIQKRLHEFNQTESALLSVNDFRTIWLEKRADPPSFQKNRKIAEETESLSSRDVTPMLESYESEDEGTQVGKKRKGKERAQDTPPVKVAAVEDDPLKVTEDELVGPFGGNQKNITEADNGAKAPAPKRSKSVEQEEPQETDENMEERLIQQQITEALNEQVKSLENTEISPTLIDPSQEATQVGTQLSLLGEDTQATLVEDSEQEQKSDLPYIPINDKDYKDLPEEEKARLTALAKQKIANEEQELLNPDLSEDVKAIEKDMETWLGDDSVLKAAKDLEKEASTDNGAKEEDEEKEEEEEDDGNLSDVDCEEIDAMILSPEEVSLKTRIWYNANKEYLEEMAVRRMIEKDRGVVPHSRKGKHKQKKKYAQANTPAEAAKQLLEKKKLSKKINQAVFDDMFESPESIAKIKERDAIKRIAGTTNVPDVIDYEVVEESGDLPITKKKTDGSTAAATGAAQVVDGDAAAEEIEEEEDEEEMDSDDMADDERLLRDARNKYAIEADDYEDYGDDDDF